MGKTKKNKKFKPIEVIVRNNKKNAALFLEKTVADLIYKYLQELVRPEFELVSYVDGEVALNRKAPATTDGSLAVVSRLAEVKLRCNKIGIRVDNYSFWSRDAYDKQEDEMGFSCDKNK